MNSELEDKCLIENDIAEIIDSFNAIEPDTYQTKRTIDEVLDKETGDVIKSEDFFKKNEAELIQYRRRLAEAIAGYKLPKFVCAYCGQLLKLSGKQTRRGQVSFFAHLHDSDDCEIKTNGEFTKEEIEIRKYSNIRESQRHIDLKNEIANALEGTRSKEIGIKDVEIEKRITSNVPYLYWKQPDIFAQFNDKSIVFELQLSTTFLSAIIDRDIFYRLNNTFIVWIFNFSDNQEYVNLSNLMCKDIYYSNKRNAFVFDNKARELSKKDGELVLLCIWFEPFVENGIFNPEKYVRKEAYIRMSDLKFDDEIFKPYFVDADSMFFKYQPDLSSNRINIEQLITIRLKKTEKQRLEREYLQNKKNEKISELKEKIKNGLAELTPYSKKENYGFECNNITIVEPIYSEVTKDSENGYFKVKKGKKYGLIDFQGELVLNCEYKELMFIFQNKCIINERNEWFYIDLKTNFKDFIHKPKFKDSIIKLEKICDIAFILRIEDTVGILHDKYNFRKYDSIGSFIDGRALANRGGYENRRLGLTQGKTVYIDKIGEEHISNAIELRNGLLKGQKFEKWGIETSDKVTIIPFEYDEISEFINGIAKACRNSLWGYVDELGNTIIPFEYNKIGAFSNNKAIACKNGFYGLINNQNETIIHFQYKEISNFSDGIAAARINQYWGCIDEKGEIIIPFKYNEIYIKDIGNIFAQKDRKYGCIDKHENIVIPFNYEEISSFIDGKAIAMKNGKYGLIDENGNIVLDFKFEKIEKFVDGIAKAKKNGYNGTIDLNGNEIIEYIVKFESGLIKGWKFGYWGVQTKENEIIIPFDYEYIGEFVNGIVKVKKNGMYGLIDETGYGFILFRVDKSFVGNYGERIINYKYGIKNTNNEIIIPAIYDEIEEFVCNRAKAKKNKKYNRGFYTYDIDYLDIYGKEIIVNIVEMESGLIKGQKLGHYGIISKENKIIVPFDYQSIEDFINGRAKAKKNDKWGFINEEGIIIIPFEYSEIGEFKDNKAIAIKNGFKGIIDINGNELNDFTYEIEHGLYCGSRFGRCGIYSKDNAIIAPFVYQIIEEFINGKAKAKKKR